MTRIYNLYMQYAYNSNQNFMIYQIKNKIFEFAHANFLNRWFLKTRRREKIFDLIFVINVKFRFKWCIIILQFYYCVMLFGKICLQRPRKYAILIWVISGSFLVNFKHVDTKRKYSDYGTWSFRPQKAYFQPFPVILGQPEVTKSCARRFQGWSLGVILG